MACSCLSRRVFLRGLCAAAAVPMVAPPAAAQMRECFGTPARFVVRTKPLGAAIDYSLQVADLTRVASAREGLFGTRTQHGQRPAGLTLADIKLDWSVAVVARGQGRQACIEPERVEVTVSMDRHRIYVARDATRSGTCQRDVVLEHESRHVRINLELLEDAKQRIERSLSDIVPQLGPTDGGREVANAALARYRAILKKPIEGGFERAFATANARHAEMDTAAAYARDWGRCA
jgi:hypothetical protein